MWMPPVSGMHASKIQTIKQAILNTPHTAAPTPGSSKRPLPPARLLWKESLPGCQSCIKIYYKSGGSTQENVGMSTSGSSSQASGSCFCLLLCCRFKAQIFLSSCQPRSLLQAAEPHTTVLRNVSSATSSWHLKSGEIAPLSRDPMCDPLNRYI